MSNLSIARGLALCRTTHDEGTNNERALVKPGALLLYLLTVAALGVAVRVALGHPLPLWWALGCLVGYLVVIGLGVALPQLEMWGEVVWHVREARGVALTFDDGPHPVHTKQALDLLDQYEAKATFFLIAHKARKHPELVREILRRGHQIGGHGFSHDRLLPLRLMPTVQDDFDQMVRSLERVSGERLALYRPPFGVLNPRLVRAADSHGLTIVGWSVRGLDGLRSTTVEKVVARVGPKLCDGAIVCLHDCAERGDEAPAGVRALPHLLEAINALNLKAVTVGELLKQRDQIKGSAQTKERS